MGYHGIPVSNTGWSRWCRHAPIAEIESVVSAMLDDVRDEWTIVTTSGTWLVQQLGPSSWSVTRYDGEARTAVSVQAALALF
jgi:hypothetical protein